MVRNKRVNKLQQLRLQFSYIEVFILLCMLHFNIVINACVSYQNFSEEHFLKESARLHEQKCQLFKSFQTIMVLLVAIEYLH